MTTHWKFASRIFALSCLCLALVPLSAQRHDVDIAVVVHPDAPVSNLNLSDVRKVFLGDRQYWSTNIPVAIAFIDSKDVKPGSKVVRVDGRLPGEAGYPLR